MRLDLIMNLSISQGAASKASSNLLGKLSRRPI